MGQPLSLTMKANIIGASAIVLAGTYFAYDLLHSEVVQPCSTLYPATVSLNLTNGTGELLSAAALQARSRSEDWGLLEKLKIEHVSGAPAPSILNFALAKDDVSSTSNPNGGAGFPWRPSRLNKPEAVCVSYNVWLPDDFDFSGGGILPGVASEPQFFPSEAGVDDDDSFARTFRAHLTWDSTGVLQTAVFDPSGEIKSRARVLAGRKTLSSGRWQRIEWELVLNSEGERNGIVRVWYDGELILDRTDVALRNAQTGSIDTVLYHVARGMPFGTGSGAAQTESSVRITPVEISWK